MKNVNNKGFSLIELMIVVAIIGILATVAIPNFQKFQGKAKQTEAKSQLGGVYMAQKAFAAEYSYYGGQFGLIGYVPQGSAIVYRILSANGPNVSGAVTINGTNLPIAMNDATCIGTNAACKAANSAAFGKTNAAWGEGTTATSALKPTTSTVTAFTATAGATLSTAAGAPIDSWSINDGNVLANDVYGI